MADDRSRLEKLLGMLASDYEGERANAAAMIARMAAKEGKTIPELCLSGGSKIVYVDRVVYRDSPFRQKPRADFSGDRTVLDRLLWAFENDDGTLSPFERDFAGQIPYEYAFDWLLSPKQMRVAKKIIKRVENADKEPLL